MRTTVSDVASRTVQPASSQAAIEVNGRHDRVQRPDCIQPERGAVEAQPTDAS